LTLSGEGGTLAPVPADQKTPAAGAVAATPRSAYLLAALLSAFLLAVPFLTTEFPPITDLPQQAAQVRLFTETISGSGEYRLNLLAPGTLGYSVFGLAWLLAGAADAGRLAYLALGLFWVGALAVTARSCRRTPTVLPLASMLYFSHALYWGFFSFLFGAALFLLWFSLEKHLRDRPGEALEIAALSTVATALYLAHLFWFIAGALWLLVASLRSPLTASRRWLRMASLLPGLGFLSFWAPRMAASGFDSETAWWTTLWSRLLPSAWVDRVFGGISGAVEPVVLSAIALWLLLGVWQHRRALRRETVSDLLWLGLAMIVLSITLPDRFQNTLHFAGRWAPAGVALLVLSLPPPRIRRALLRLVPVVLLATLSLATTATWRAFERQELAGLDASLAALPENPRLLGLDFYRLSHLVKTQPFFQIPAYGQVLRGGHLGFSFASFPASPVVFRQWENPPWTSGLEWLPHQIFESMEDVLHFDFVLVHADRAGQAYFEQQTLLEPMTGEGRWRLYRVVGSGT
jgi:hypothetical protein